MGRHQLRVYIIIFSVIVTQMFIVIGEEMVHYTGSNFVECPPKTYQVAFSSNCTEKCPHKAPYAVFNLCLDFCPVGLSVTCNSIIAKTALSPTKTANISVLRCLEVICPKDRPYCYNFKCLSDCPKAMIKEDFACVYHCSSRTSMVYNRSCVNECPEESQYNESGTCVSKCSTYNARHGNVCVRNCPSNMFRYNRTCITSCPEHAPFEFEILKTKLCFESCPDFTFVEQKQCKLQCPQGLAFLWNRTCVKRCPESAPIIYVLSRRVPQIKIPICIENCPDGTFFDGITCVESCDKHMFVYNSTCVSECPPSNPFVVNHVCLSQCPSNLLNEYGTCVKQCSPENYIFNVSCVKSCPETHKYSIGRKCFSNCTVAKYLYWNDTCVYSCPQEAVYILNYTCVSECPPSNPFVVNQVCLSQCPSNLLNEYGTCVKQCSPENYIFDVSCVKSCPETHKYSIGRKCFSNCTVANYLYWNDTCVYTCPQQAAYIFNHTCLTVCPLSHPFYKSYQKWIHNFWRRSTFNYCLASCNDSISPESWVQNGNCKCSAPLLSLSHNATCVERCPSSYEFVHNGKCIANCPENLVGYNGTCRTSCPNNVKYVYDGQCRELCPASHPYHAMSNPNSFICLDTCADSKKSPGRFLYNMTCVRRCPDSTVLYGSKCIHSCPLDKPLVYKKESNGKYIHVCVKKCPGTTFTRGSHCYDQCPESLASFLPNRTCVERCPAQRRFRYRFRTNGNNFAYRCKTSCDKRIVNNTVCVDTCPSEAQFISGQSCVPKCPASHTFLEPNEYRCLTSCQPPLVAYNHTCSKHCPGNVPFIMNNICVSKCPRMFNLTAASSQGLTCLHECKYPLLRENNKCTRTCKGKFIVNNVCEDIVGCPNEYKYMKTTSQGTFCRKACLENEFVDEEVHCTMKCPKFVVENRCVEKCPAKYPYTSEYGHPLRCYSTCPQLSHDKTCVYACPISYLELKSNKTCIKECPASDPFKSYETCLKVCPGSQIVSGNNACIYASECDQSKGLYIHESKCVSQCPDGTYSTHSNNTCIPLPLGEIAAGIILAVFSIGCFVAVYSLCRSTKICKPKIVGDDIQQADTDDRCQSVRVDATENTEGHERYHLTSELLQDSLDIPPVLDDSPRHRNHRRSKYSMDDSSQYNFHDSTPKEPEDESSVCNHVIVETHMNDDSSQGKHNTIPKAPVDESSQFQNATTKTETDDDSLQFKHDTTPKTLVGESSQYQNVTMDTYGDDDSLQYKNDTTPKTLVDESSRDQNVIMDTERDDDSLQFKHGTTPKTLVDESSQNKNVTMDTERDDDSLQYQHDISRTDKS